VRFRKTPLEIALDNLDDNAKYQHLSAVARDLVEGERGMFLLTMIRNMTQEIHEQFEKGINTAATERNLGALAALRKLRDNIVSLLPEDVEIQEDEAEEDEIAYDSPFQLRPSGE